MQEELPPYDCSSPLPGYITARGLGFPTETISLLSGGSQAGEYNYKSDHLHINLGPRRWGTRFPVYGFQDVVEGTAQVTKKCSHVVSVTATVSLPWSQYLRPRRLTRWVILIASRESCDYRFPRRERRCCVGRSDPVPEHQTLRSRKLGFAGQRWLKTIRYAVQRVIQLFFVLPDVHRRQEGPFAPLAVVVPARDPLQHQLHRQSRYRAKRPEKARKV